MRIKALLIIAVMAVGAAAFADGIVELPEGRATKVANWDAYVRELSVRCTGPLVTMEKPHTLKIGDKSFKITGYKMSLETPKKKSEGVKIGIVSTSKDVTDETKHNLKNFTDWFKAEGVDSIIMGGDIYDKAKGVSDMLEILAKSGLPVYAVMGNNDIRGEFNRGVQNLNKKYPNVINMNLIRLVDANGYDIISLPGYYDPQYTASRNTCVYSEKDIALLDKLVKEAKDPILFLSHGPPKDVGKDGIDYATSGANVGDKRMTDFVNKHGIPFGVFGHIIEAGGKATALDGKVIPEGNWASKLHLNPGSSSGVYWGMNDGKGSVGMAAILEIKGKQARYTIKNIDAEQHKQYRMKSDESEKDALESFEPK